MTSSHELQATLNALGYLEDGQYYKSRDCLSMCFKDFFIDHFLLLFYCIITYNYLTFKKKKDAAKDLVRYLRRDDPNEKSIRRELLKTDVITNDFIPLMKILNGKKDAELFDIILRLLVNLTQSAFNCFEQKLPEEKIQYNIYMEIDNRL